MLDVRWVDKKQHFIFSHCGNLAIYIGAVTGSSVRELLLVISILTCLGHWNCFENPILQTIR